MNKIHNSIEKNIMEKQKSYEFIFLNLSNDCCLWISYKRKQKLPSHIPLKIGSMLIRKSLSNLQKIKWLVKKKKHRKNCDYACGINVPVNLNRFISRLRLTPSVEKSKSRFPFETIWTWLVCLCVSRGSWRLAWPAYLTASITSAFSN